MSKPADDVPDLVLPTRAKPAAAEQNGPPSSKVGPKPRPSQQNLAAQRAAPKQSGMQVAGKAGPPSQRSMPAQPNAPPPSSKRGYLGDEAPASLQGVAMGGEDDDPFADDDQPGLDLAVEKKESVRDMRAHVMAPEVPQPGEPGAVIADGTPVKVKREPTPAEKLGAFGDVPTAKQPWNWPIYAVMVLKRQNELRAELAEKRAERSPEVPLYEEALNAYDKATFARGAVMIAGVLLLFMLALLSPVIVRFWKLAMD